MSIPTSPALMAEHRSSALLITDMRRLWNCWSSDVSPNRPRNRSRTLLWRASFQGSDVVVVVNPLLARNIVNPDEPACRSQTPLLIVSIPWSDAIVALIQPRQPLSLSWLVFGSDLLTLSFCTHMHISFARISIYIPLIITAPALAPNLFTALLQTPPSPFFPSFLFAWSPIFRLISPMCLSQVAILFYIIIFPFNLFWSSILMFW